MENDECQYYIALVHSHSLAIRAENICKKADIRIKLIPTPRHLSSDCGVVLRFEKKDREAVIEAFEVSKLEYDRIVLL